MENKNYLTPFFIVLLTISFSLVCIIVFITKGKSSFWISKKIKFGALLLSLNSVVSLNCCTTCYDVPGEPIEPENIITLDNVGDDKRITLDLNNNNKITGKIEYCIDNKYSFAIIDKYSMKDTVQIDDLKPIDNIFDSETERFEITLNSACKKTFTYLM